MIKSVTKLVSFICFVLVQLSKVLIQLYSLRFCIPVDLLKQRTVRFDGHRATKEHQMRKVKAKAQKTVAAMQKQHAAELQHEQSKHFKRERESPKKIVQLEGQLKSVKSDALKQALLAQAEYERQLESQKRTAEKDMKAARAIQKSEQPTVQALPGDKKSYQGRGQHGKTTGHSLGREGCCRCRKKISQ